MKLMVIIFINALYAKKYNFFKKISITPCKFQNYML